MFFIFSGESCDFGSAKYYAICGFGGILSCGLTHTAVVPLDLVKCRIQVSVNFPQHINKKSQRKDKDSSCDKDSRKNDKDFTCARKGITGIVMFILIASRSGERKMIPPIRVASGPFTRIKKWNQFSQIQMSIYQSNTIEKTQASYILSMRRSKQRTSSLSYLFCSLINIFKLQLGAPAQT